MVCDQCKNIFNKSLKSTMLTLLNMQIFKIYVREMCINYKKNLNFVENVIVLVVVERLKTTIEFSKM